MVSKILRSLKSSRMLPLCISTYFEINMNYHFLQAADTPTHGIFKSNNLIHTTELSKRCNILTHSIEDWLLKFFGWSPSSVYLEKNVWEH